MPIQVAEAAEALEADNRRKPGQVERELWECSNLGTQGKALWRPGHFRGVYVDPFVRRLLFALTHHRR